MITARRLAATGLAAALLALAPSARAGPANRSVSLEAGVARGRPVLALGAAAWLEGEVEALARVEAGSAPRPEGRAADPTVTVGAGLRWAPERWWGWRPSLAAEAGVRFGAGRAPATAALRAGLERRLSRRLALGLAGGARWTSGEGAAPGAAVGLAAYF